MYGERTKITTGFVGVLYSFSGKIKTDAKNSGQECPLYN